MRAAVLALLLSACSASAALAEEPDPKTRAFVDVVVPHTPVFVGQPFTLTLRVIYQPAYFEKHAAPLFRREMDLQVHVRAPWIDALPGTRGLDAAQGEGVRVALNDDVVGADGPVIVDEAGIHEIRFERRYVADQPVTLEIAAPTLRFVHATEFEEDFVGGRNPVDPRDVVVTGTARTLEVLPPPEEGRPASYRDAVGRFTVRAEADRAAVDLDEVFRLTLVIEGEGNLATLQPPRLEDLDAFHVFGRIDDQGAPRRTIVYEMAAVEGAAEGIPAVPLAFFDPGPPPTYRVVRTEPIALDVRAPVVTESESGGLPWLWGGLLVAAGAALLLGAFARRRGRGDPAQAVIVPEDTGRIDAATSALRAEVREEGGDVTGAFAEYLAAHLDRRPAAVVGPRLGARLVEAGVPEDLARRTAATMEGLMAARYGAGDPAAVEAALLDELEAAWARRPAQG